MNLKIERVNSEEKELLKNLLQLYLHDLSLYSPINFDSNSCEYHYDLDKYFNNDYAFFIKDSDNILGFILVDNNLNNNYEISEMFVLNNYKDKNIGEESVKIIFDKYRGNWTIKSVPLSQKAESFWNKTINNYTNGNYKLSHIGKYDRAEFYFSNLL